MQSANWTGLPMFWATRAVSVSCVDFLRGYQLSTSIVSQSTTVRSRRTSSKFCGGAITSQLCDGGNGTNPRGKVGSSTWIDLSTLDLLTSEFKCGTRSELRVKSYDVCAFPRILLLAESKEGGANAGGGARPTFLSWPCPIQTTRHRYEMQLSDHKLLDE